MWGVSTDKGISDNTNLLIIGHFIAWKDTLPQEWIDLHQKRQVICMLTWEPYISDSLDVNVLKRIADGKEDYIIGRMQEQLAKIKSPVWIRFGHEMNGNWYSWSGSNNGPDGAVLYKEAFVYLKRKFIQKTNDSTSFIFCVNREDVPNNSKNRFESYYPGSEYVDIVGLDAYDKCKNTAKSLLIEPYERIVRMAPDKPVVVTEIATACTKKHEWLVALNECIKTDFRSIKAVVWFDYVKEENWSLGTDTAAGELIDKWNQDINLQLYNNFKMSLIRKGM
ncbi:MAG: hypothetical protein JNL74_12100 [Fibrobacteres bacterium]|nr:hypothetical protein [Fibrobacterota bacterium]